MKIKLLGRSSIIGALTWLTVLIGGASASAANIWTFDWDASTQTPESIGLTFSNGLNPNEPTAEGLIIPATGYYSGEIFNGLSITGWTLAFRVRRVDVSDSFGAFFTVWDNESEVRFDYFANSHYRITSSTGNQYISAPNGDNRDFIDVQISKLGEDVNIYFGQSDTPVLSYTAASSLNPENILMGNYSTGTSVSEISYLRWTNEGAFLPSQMVPEPATILLMVGAMVFLIPAFFRKREV